MILSACNNICVSSSGVPMLAFVLRSESSKLATFAQCGHTTTFHIGIPELSDLETYSAVA